MKLTVLGGSAAGPNTGQGCSGYLVSGNDTRIVLDLGPGTLPELRRHGDFRTLDAILVSHLHLDHILDLFALRFALAYNPVPAPLPVPLWLPPGGEAILRKAGAAFDAPGSHGDFFAPMFSIAEYDPMGSVEIGEFAVSFARTVHPLPCWAMRLSSRAQPDRDLVYTADTGPTANLSEFAGGAAVLVAEATLLTPGDEPIEERGHLTATEAGELASQAGVETLILTHMWEEIGVDEAQRQAAISFSGRIAVARPGLSIEW